MPTIPRGRIRKLRLARMALGARRLIREEDILQALKANPPSHSAEDIESMKMDEGGFRPEV